MSEDQSRTKSRKGTTSCTECRRRKIRCIRDYEGAQTCRKCQERGSECVVQVYSSHPSDPPRISSRARISQLESQVSSLSRVVRDIESKLGYQTSRISSTASAEQASNPGIEDSDDDSSDSDILATNPPSQLHSLFQNDWLSVDTPPKDEQSQSRKAKASSLLQNAARHALQELIPSRDEVADIARSATRWLDLLHSMLPQPLAAKSDQDIIDSYDDMRKPDVDPTILASWLLTIALSAQQKTADHGTPAAQVQQLTSFPKAVLDAVENKIIIHDKLVCTIQGVAMGVHFFRLQMSMGNLQKAWLRLRHFRAVGELIGLPKAFQIVQLNNSTGLYSSEAQIHRALLWETLNFIDGLFGTLINLPPCINPYRQTSLPLMGADGDVQPRIYSSRLIDISTKIQYDNMNTEQGSSTELYASVLDLDRQLQLLSSQTPKSWWIQDTDHVKPEHIIQFLHYCVKMRVHLFFAMRQDPGNDFIYSRLACTEACESVAQRYQFLRNSLPAGIFICQILDLQVFTAMVVLLLTSRSSSSSNRSNVRGDQDKVDILVAQVVKVIDENSAVTAGVNLARSVTTTLRALSGLLRQDDDTTQVQELTLKVPLLGKVHIRRNNHSLQAPNPVAYHNSASSVVPSRQNITSQDGRRSLLGPGTHIASAPQMGEQFQWDPLTWSVEDQMEDYFQDALMADNVDQFSMWQDNQGDFNFHA